MSRHGTLTNDAGLVSCVEESFKPGWECKNDGAMLADCMLPEVLVFFVEDESMYLSEAKSKVRQFLVARCSADLEKSLEAAPEEMANIDMLVGDLQSEADWDFADLTGGPDLGSRPNIRGHYGHLREACHVVRGSATSSVTDLLTFSVRGVEPMRRASIGGVRVCALEAIVSSNNTRIGELESQPGLQNSELDAAVAELESKRALSSTCGGCS